MPRHARPQPVRRLVPGALRAGRPGDRLQVLLLAPGPDWVVADLATGALVRSALTRGVGEEAEIFSSDPLAAITLELGPPVSPADASRPESVQVSRATDCPGPRRGKVKAFLEQVASPADDRPLLGSVGPSVAYGDLRGERPSVSFLMPDKGRIVFAGEGTVMGHFRVAGAAHALPVAEGLLAWLKSGQLPSTSGTSSRRGHSTRSSRRLGPLGPATEPSVPVRAVVGFGPPEGGQVRKVLLGAIPIL